MSWQVLTAVSPREQVDLLSLALEQLGALAVTLEDGEDRPILEPGPGMTPLWPTVRLSALFDADTERAPVTAALARLDTLPRPDQLHWQTLADQDWTRVWLERFEPMHFGHDLWVVPGGQEAPGGTVIRLDPGLAFGTGTHPTTALCLEWLAAHPPRHQAVLDYGCGSGILAVAAALLGAGPVLAVDHDPQALIATGDNARRNGVSGRITASAPGDDDDWSARTMPLILANILAAPLVSLAPRLTACCEAGGSLILAGLLSAQADEVLAAYADGFDFSAADAVAERDGWVRLWGRRR